MSNPLVQDKASYIKDLLHQINSKPSKLELYKQKVNERELYDKNYFLDHPDRVSDRGILKGYRRYLRDNQYDDVKTNSYNPIYTQQGSPMMDYYYQDNANSQYIPELDSGFHKTTPLRNLDNRYSQQIPTYLNSLPNVNEQNMYNRPSPYRSNSSNSYSAYSIPNKNNFHTENPNYQVFPSMDYNSSAKALRKTSSNEQNGASEYISQSGLGILPQDRPNNKKEIQKQYLKDYWSDQIEEKKRRQHENKIKELEEDYKQEEKWMRYMEEQKTIENQAQQEKIRKANEASQALSPIPQKNPKQIEKLNRTIRDMSQLNSTLNVQENSFQMTNEQSNPFQDQYQYQQMNCMNYPNSNGALVTNIQDKITELRDDVNNKYIEMSNIFGKLKMDIAEANQLKSEAEKEHQFIRDDLLKQKIQDITYETKLNTLFEKNPPYLHKPIKACNPLYNSTKERLQSSKTSNPMNYSSDMLNQRTSRNLKSISSLAKVGQSLVGESQFVPIQSTNFPTEDNYQLRSENRFEDIKKSYSFKDGSMVLNNDKNNDSVKAKENILNKAEYEDMYNKLNDITDINNQINPLNKYNTLSNNLEIDYKMINNNKRYNEELKKLDNMLNELIEDKH